MTEQQADYDTDASPTPGPWQADVDHQPNKSPLIVAHTKPESQAHAVGKVTRGALLEGDWKSNARLIAAAGTAAHESKEMGYDPVAAVEALPELLQQAEKIVDDSYERSCDPGQETRTPPSRDLIDDLDGLLAQIVKGADALASAEGSGDE